MARLALILITAGLLIGLAELAVEPLLEHVTPDEEIAESIDPTERFLDLLSDSRLLVYRMTRRYDALPEPKSAAELRVFVVGNSTALFQMEPAVIQAELARALPGRELRVVPLLLPMLQTADELLLVRAALAKQADVVVVTPAVRGLMVGDSFLSPLLRDHFEAAVQPRPRLTALPGRLADRLALVRHGGELRAVVVRRFTQRLHRGSRAARRLRLDEDLAAVAQAARTGDPAALEAAYESRGLGALLRRTSSLDLLPAQSAVWPMLGEMARAVSAHGAHGVAIFMPANPLLRGTEPTLKPWQLDDAWAREVARRALLPFSEAGWDVFNALDALPAEAFIDLVHVRDREYAKDMSQRTARLVLRALRSQGAASMPSPPLSPPRP